MMRMRVRNKETDLTTALVCLCNPPNSPAIALTLALALKHDANDDDANDDDPRPSQ